MGGSREKWREEWREEGGREGKGRGKQGKDRREVRERREEWITSEKDNEKKRRPRLIPRK